MEFKDYYQILGVARDASAEAIKAAFRKLARKYHPDVSKEPDAEARMKEVNEAYAVLADTEKRAAYDQLGHDYHAGQDFRPPPDWDAGFEFSGRGFSGADAAEFSDFFSQLFGHMGGHGGGFQARGEDHHAKILVDLAVAYRGGSRTLRLRVPRQDARGRVTLADHTLNVRIPKGVHAGQVIRLTGQGAPGVGSAPAGDLYLEVHFEPDARYRVEGRDVYATLPVTPWEAALGATVKAPVPDGAVEVRIPAASRSGRKLRLRGRGIPGAPPGDLYLVLDIHLPPADTPRARALYETMASELAFDPRRNPGG
ncbi:MAG: DnaJ C-terminal domain-containing protein [Porticoccaceae bacterium]